MADSQQTLDDFTSNSVSQPDSDNTEVQNEEKHDSKEGYISPESTLVSPEKQNKYSDGESSRQGEHDGPLAEFGNSISSDTGLQFGKDPDEFDIPCIWARRYMAHRCAKTLDKKPLSENSIPNYVTVLREFVNFLHGHGRKVLSAEFQAVRAYLSYSVDLGRRTSTIMQQVSRLKALYKHINLKENVEATISPLEFEEINRDAIQELTPPDLQREHLSKEDLKKLFDALPRDRDRLMAILGVETGFRNSDIRGVRLEDLDLDVPEVYAHDPKYSDPYTVPISEEMALELEIWVETGRKHILGEENSAYLFPGTGQDWITTNKHFNKIILDAAEDAGIQGILGRTKYRAEYLRRKNVDRKWHRVIPHALRHSFITLLEQEGVPLEYRMLLANHSNAETTRIYSHGKKDILKNAQNRLDINY